MRNDSVIPLLTFEDPKVNSFDELFELSENNSSPETAAHLLNAILKAQVKPSFYKINVHAAMTPVEIQKYFTPVIEQAELLLRMYKQVRTRVASHSSSSSSSSLPSSLLTKKKDMRVNRPPTSTVAPSPDINLDDSDTVPPFKTPFVTVSANSLLGCTEFLICIYYTPVLY